MTVRVVGETVARCDLRDVVDVVADVAHETMAAPPSAPTHSFASALRETAATLYEEGEARVERPSALLALPASSDLRPELGDDGDATAAAAAAL